jgi:toxin HigB-1
MAAKDGSALDAVSAFMNSELRGDRKGQHSIRINYQYRVCFVWNDDGPERVEITDYH